MKRTFLAILITLTFSSVLNAKDFQVVKTDICKTRATLAALYDAQKKSSHNMLDVKAKSKSAMEGTSLYHFIDVTDLMTMQTSTITVTVDAENCHIKSIN
jgi:hypothetical protein